MEHGLRLRFRVLRAALALTALAWFAFTATPVQAAPAAAQGGRAGDPAVKVFVRSPLIRVGETTALVIDVSGADRVQIVSGPRSQAPSVEIGAPSGPSRQVRTSIVNGRRRDSVRTLFQIPVRGTEAGNFELSPVELTVDGRTVTAPEEALELRVVKDMRASEVLVFERDPLPERVFEGEPFDVELRFGWDTGLPARAVELTLPWWNGLDGVLEIDAPRGSARGQAEIFVNRGRRPVGADLLGRTKKGETEFQLLRLRRRYLASRPGQLEFEGAVFEFIETVRAGSVFDPGETRSYFATLEPRTIEVLPVPEAGRPFEWTGAVGVIEAARSVDRRDVDVGDSIKLQVTWTGTGNLEFFDPPELDRLDAFKGFRVVGVDDDRDADRRRTVYDLVPLLPGEQSIPSVPLWVFDTGREEYVEVKTEPVPLRVKRVAGAEDAFANLGEDEPAVVLDLRDIHPRPERGARGSGPSGWLLLGSLGGLLVAWPFARTALRRGADPGSRQARRRRGAKRRLAARLRRASGPAEQADALHEYLAARTGEAPEAWVGRDAREFVAALERERGVSAGVDAPALERLETLRVELDRARFAADGQGAAIDATRLKAAVRDLEGSVL